MSGGTRGTVWSRMARRWAPWLLRACPEWNLHWIWERTCRCDREPHDLWHLIAGYDGKHLMASKSRTEAGR